jgi:hypothetical protein
MGAAEAGADWGISGILLRDFVVTAGFLDSLPED